MEGSESGYFREVVAETDEGMRFDYAGEILLRNAVAVTRREDWQACPVCDARMPLFYGDPDGAHWCSLCQIQRELYQRPYRVIEDC